MCLCFGGEKKTNPFLENNYKKRWISTHTHTHRKRNGLNGWRKNGWMDGWTRWINGYCRVPGTCLFVCLSVRYGNKVSLSLVRARPLSVIRTESDDGLLYRYLLVVLSFRLFVGWFWYVWMMESKYIRNGMFVRCLAWLGWVGCVCEVTADGEVRFCFPGYFFLMTGDTLLHYYYLALLLEVPGTSYRCITRMVNVKSYHLCPDPRPNNYISYQLLGLAYSYK